MPPRLYAYGAGGLLLLLGTAGFVVTGFSGYVEANSGDVLLGLRLNPMLNFVHMALGATWMWAGASEEPVATATTAAVAVLVLALGVGGLWLTGRPDYNIVAVNTADNLLHLLIGGLGLVVALRGLGAVAEHAPQQAQHPDE